MRARSLIVAALLVVVPLGVLPLNSGAATPTCHGKHATIVMTAPGSITGTAGDDVIVGSNGNDTIDTFFSGPTGGVDIVCGGGGNDTITVEGPGSIADGESGQDTV